MKDSLKETFKELSVWRYETHAIYNKVKVSEVAWRIEHALLEHNENWQSVIFDTLDFLQQWAETEVELWDLKITDCDFTNFGKWKHKPFKFMIAIWYYLFMLINKMGFQRVVGSVLIYSSDESEPNLLGEIVARGPLTDKLVLMCEKIQANQGVFATYLTQIGVQDEDSDDSEIIHVVTEKSAETPEMN